MNQYSGRPGWYPDPFSASGGQRYWTGQQWTAYAPYLPPRPDWWRDQSIVSKVVLGLFAAVYVVVAMAGISQCASHQSLLRNRCEAQVGALGFEGAEKERAVEICVKYAS